MNDEQTISATRRRPQQARSRLLVASIREACRRVLREAGPGQPLTAKRIAEVAGVTIGSFYQYYPNKEAVLFDVLLESAPGEAGRIADESRYLGTLRWESVEGTLRGLVEVTCERHRRMLALHGDIYRRYHRQLQFESLVLANVQRYVQTDSLEKWLQELLRHHRPELDAAAVEISAFLIASTLNDMCARAVEEHPQWLESAQFRAELQRLLVDYAQGDPRRPGQAGLTHAKPAS